MQTNDAVIAQRDNGIGWLIMNRPDKRNAIDANMSRRMYSALDAFADDDEVDVVILTGAGSAFSTGIDLSEPPIDIGIKATSHTEEHLPALQDRIRDRSWMADRLLHYEKITIAMVNGWCVAGALSPVLACDLAIAADEAQFSVSEVNWGGLPAGLTTKLLVDTLSYRDALYYVLTGEVFDGKAAAAIGLVNRSVPGDDLRSTTKDLAAELLSKDQLGLLASKDTCRAVRSMNHHEAKRYTNMKMALIRQTASEQTIQPALERFLTDKTYKPALETFRDDSKN